MKKTVFLIFLSVLLLCPGCKQKPGLDVPGVAPGSAGTGDENIAVDISKLTFTENYTAPAAHKKYLDDLMVFMEFPAKGSQEPTAVVGNTTALFYPGVLTVKAGNLNKLPEGILLPLGVVIPIKGKIENSDPEYDGLFEFETQYNYFYKTEWEGRKGAVFGADLYGTGNTQEHNAIAALYYQQAARFKVFPPFTGYSMLADEEKEQIARDRIAFQEVRYYEYNLTLENPDDMIALYKKEVKDRQKPLFITTDLVAHSLHLFFGKYLQYIEESHFFPRLKTLITGYLEAIAALEARSAGSTYQQTLELANRYFQVAGCLVELAPEAGTGENAMGQMVIVYSEPDREEVLARFPEKVQEEVKLILSAAGTALSPNFRYEEDYTQYKPRGHYTKNGILESYFRSMMWFGRLHVYISLGQEINLAKNAAEAGQDTALELSEKLMPVAALITQISIDHPALYTDWQQLFDPVTAMIGMSDDLSFYDLIPFWKSLGIRDFAAWVEKRENIVKAINQAYTTLRPPLITGNSVFSAPAGEDRKPPLGWRLFGQRFTYDSSIHQLVSPPRLMTREMVRGLDIMKVFGSHTAEQLLQLSDYPAMAGLKTILDKLQVEFEKLSPGIWSETYYNRVLYLVKAQAAFEPGAGFFFTETPAWGIKAQLSAHGTWAALRHDTILYVKQVYAEMAGEGWTATYRILPVPEPVHYIEPNQVFFKGAAAAVLQLAKIARDYNLDNEFFSNHIGIWSQLLANALRITESEYNDQAVPPEDVGWISTIPAQLADLVLPPEADSTRYMDGDDALKGAVVADVYTNAQTGKVLEVGTGIPYRIYVALNDGQGGKRIAVGYTYSYYEFPAAQNSRLNNEEWRKMVYAEKPDLTGKLPFWARGIALPPLH